MRSPDGFSLIEVLVALALLSTVAASLAGALHQAAHARKLSRDILYATELAADTIEAWRSGAPGEIIPIDDARFQRSIRILPDPETATLHEIEVSVSWTDGRPHTVQLRTSARR